RPPGWTARASPRRARRAPVARGGRGHKNATGLRPPGGIPPPGGVGPPALPQVWRADPHLGGAGDGDAGRAGVHRPQPRRQEVYIATGDSGMGMTHGTLAGLLLTDLILGRDNPWAALYDPARKPLKTLGTFLSENVNVAVKYGAWLTPGDVSTVGEIAPGCGAVVRQGLYKRAVYRDDKGELHVYSAVCPHLGGIVSWNDAEKTWDCPL